MTGSTGALLPVGHTQKTSKGRHPGSILIRCPKHLSSPLYVRAPHPIWGWAQKHYGGNISKHSVFTISLSRSLSRVHDHRWGLEHINPKLYLSAQLPLHNNALVTADATSICLTISRSILPSRMNKTPGYLNSFTPSGQQIHLHLYIK